MDQNTARKLFRALYQALDQNGFEDEVATFLIRLDNNNFYPDSNIALDELYAIAQERDRAKYALRMLAVASRDYFRAASAIGERYQSIMSTLTNRPLEPLIFTARPGQEDDSYSYDLNNLLQRPALSILFKMVEFIIADIDSGNEDNDHIIEELKAL